MHSNLAIKLSAFFGFLGGALVLVATSRYGTGLSSDSVTYLAAAQNLADLRGYVNFNGAPVLAFPPLFSAMIAVFSAGLFEPVSVARFINALCFGLAVFLAAHWLFRHLHSYLLALLGTTSILSSAALIGISMYAWSEPLFLVLTMLMLFQLQRDDFNDSRASWVLTGMFAALAILTRYAGIMVVMAGTILLAVKRMNNIASLVRRLFLFLSVAILPISLWFYRNYTISSTLTGYRAASARTWIQSSYDMMNVLSLWFLPPSVLFRYRVYLMILLILLFSGIVFLVVGRKIALANIRETLPFLLFTCMYTAFMIYTTAKTALSPIDDRYLSPIFVPLILSVFYLMDSLLYHFRIKTGSTFPRAILAASLAIWLIYPIATTYRTVKVSLEEGAGGFHSTDWAESDLISYLRDNELTGTIYTNEPSAVYALTGQVYNPSPEKFAYESQVSTDDLLRFQADVQRRGVIYIVWFHTDWWKGYLYDVDDLNKICALERIVTRKDGDVYRVRASHCLPPA